MNEGTGAAVSKIPAEDYEAVVTRLRTVLGDAVCRGWWEAGRGFSRDEAVDFATAAISGDAVSSAP